MITVGLEDSSTDFAKGFEDIYLGVSTGLGFSPTIGGKPNRAVYGWVHLHALLSSINNAVLQMVENVMSYDSPGIIVGTTTLVPEPASASMFLCAIAGVLSGRRRRLIPHQRISRTVVVPRDPSMIGEETAIGVATEFLRIARHYHRRLCRVEIHLEPEHLGLLLLSERADRRC